MFSKKVFVTIITVSILSGASYYLLAPKSSQQEKKVHQKLRKSAKRKNIFHSKKNIKKQVNMKRRIEEGKWEDIGDYKYKEKLTKHFQRFRSKSNGRAKSAPTVTLKLGKLNQKKQKTKTFFIREVLVTIKNKTGIRNFIALVNEKTGKVLQKQGRRIRDPLSRIGHRAQRGFKSKKSN